MQQRSTRQSLLADFMYRVWSSGEIDACDQYLAGSYTISHDPGDPWDGRTLTLAEFKERVRFSRAPCPDQRFDILEWFENGDTVAVTWLWSATHQGDIAGFPATGKPLKMSGATVYKFDSANRICGHWQVVDRLWLYRQLQQGR